LMILPHSCTVRKIWKRVWSIRLLYKKGQKAKCLLEILHLVG
jgi:hypothetical protein